MVRTFFTNRLEEFADRECLFSGEGAPFSYAELLLKGDAIASKFGDARKLVFLEGGNSFATVAAYVGCLRAGHVVHILDPSKQEDNSHLVSTFRPNLRVQCSEKDWNVEIVNNAQIQLSPDLALLLSTSGSTGSSKFVKISYQNLEENTKSIVEYLKLTNQDRAISVLQPFYSYGLSVLNTHLSVGASILLTRHSVQSDEFWSDFKRFKCTNFSGVPHTFQVLERKRVDLADYPYLRFATQAGGKLTPSLVRKYARLGEDNGFDFFVMYGQTEASPRISYLPAGLAAENPDSIGVPIPGGALWLVDERDKEIATDNVEGELVYAGPNVMIGYANRLQELATTEEVRALRTGDLAIRKRNGLYSITGRKARFIKLFGLRISLDDVESFLHQFGFGIAVVGDDSVMSIYFEGDLDVEQTRALLAKRYSLPESSFELKRVNALPRLGNGKIDYSGLSTLPGKNVGEDRQTESNFRDLLKRVGREFISILLGDRVSWNSAKEIFAMSFPKKTISNGDSFVSLGGDSLSFVEISIALEEYIGYLPSEWYKKSIYELQLLKRSAAM